MILKFKDAVIDSHRHFFEDLGVVPTIDDIFSDLENGSYDLENDVNERLDEYYVDISSILDNNNLEYKN